MSEPPAKQKRRKMEDRFDIEIQFPERKGREGRTWHIIKSFYDLGEAYQYERYYENLPENYGTPLRVKAKRVPVQDQREIEEID